MRCVRMIVKLRLFVFYLVAEEQLARLEQELRRRKGQIADANDELALLQQAIDEEVNRTPLKVWTHDATLLAILQAISNNAYNKLFVSCMVLENCPAFLIS